ncbi:MAG: CBS domain-containing protein [bacterium]|nr:CBS domain-containing protein [bacterium]
MKVRSLLTDRETIAVRLDDTVLEAVRRMTQTRCGSVLVNDEGGKMKGIFTERDLMVRVVSQGENPSEVRVADVMTKNVYVASPEQTIVEVRREMRDLHIRHVPVVEGDRVLEVLSMRDLQRADLQEKRETAEHMSAYIRGEQ